MFTGIVTGIGRLRDRSPIGAGADMRLVIGVPDGADWAGIAAVPVGASIACAGCCLTAVALGPDWFAVDVSAETLSKTALGGWQPGQPINLERALRLGDELGGHLVSGHVDGLGEVMDVRAENGSHRIEIAAPADLARFIAPKGSIAIDGVSLTVNAVDGARFGVNIIPHTAAATTLGMLQPGARVHLEIDMLARYVARMRECA